MIKYTLQFASQSGKKGRTWPDRTSSGYPNRVARIREHQCWEYTRQKEISSAGRCTCNLFPPRAVPYLHKRSPSIRTRLKVPQQCCPLPQSHCMSNQLAFDGDIRRDLGHKRLLRTVCACSLTARDGRSSPIQYAAALSIEWTRSMLESQEHPKIDNKHGVCSSQGFCLFAFVT